MRTTPATADVELLKRWMIGVEEGDNTDKRKEILVPLENKLIKMKKAQNSTTKITYYATTKSSVEKTYKSPPRRV